MNNLMELFSNKFDRLLDGVEMLSNETSLRFDNVNKRFDDVNKRFDDVNV